MQRTWTRQAIAMVWTLALFLAVGCSSPSEEQPAEDAQAAVDGSADNGTLVGGDTLAGTDALAQDDADPVDTVLGDAEAVADTAQLDDALLDAVPSDASADAEAPKDVAADVAVDVPPAVDVGCVPPAAFNYTCQPGAVDDCSKSGGVCLLGLCLAPKKDPARWDNCGNKTCEMCETGCPVDCAAPPTLTGAKDFGGDKTISIWVHGFSNQGADKLKALTFGSIKGCGDVLENTQLFGNPRVCGDKPGNDTDPNQMIAVEYYGANPPAWMTPQDIADVEKFPYSGGPTGLQRYATIVAKFVKWRMAVSGAKHVNMACHSMGCLITRQMLENDYEGLASSQTVVRWFTATGVVDGAQLAWLFNNPTVQQVATTIGLELSDFILMNPDYVWDNTPAWDHKLYAANNPLFKGMLIHHVGATDPRIQQALKIQLLDVLNPTTSDPNDGIMFTEDEYFHDQDPAVAAKSLGGEPVKPTRGFVYADHMECPGTLNTAVNAAAALFHHRKVVITVDKFELLKDRETHAPFDGEYGSPPAEVVVESETRFLPYLKTAFPKVKDDLIISNDKVEYRTSPMWQQNQGDTAKPGAVVFSGPVFDDMTELYLDVWLNEADTYPHYGVNELALDFKPTKPLVDFHGQVPLTDGATFAANNAYGKATFKVRVYTMY